MAEAAELMAPDLRGSRRTNLLLTASIEFAELSAQVRIRNVSETGALIEGAHVPNPGARLWLKRADLKIAGTIVWSKGGKAGVHFDEPVQTEFWGGGKPKPIELTGLRDQRRVDAVQQAIRSGRSTSAYEAASAPPGEAQLNARIAEEMKYVARLIESLGDQLAGDPAVLHKHLQSLQNIDMANQILCHLANLVGSDDPDAKVAEIGMTDLRARLTRTSLG